MANQQPSINPADESTLAGVIKTAIAKDRQSLDVMLPVEVVSYDRATNRATVRHLVQMVGSDGEAVSRANVASVRVQQFGNAAFNISLPIKPGDKGWLMAADRDISTFQQGLGESQPNTARTHSFQDGMFMPDAMSNGDAPGGAGDDVVIGANDGSAYMSIGAGGFKWVGPWGEVTLDGGGLKMNGINIGDTHVHGGVAVGGATTDVPQ